METKPETVEYLNLRNLVDKMPKPKKVGGKPFLVPRLFIQRITNKWHKMKTKLETYVGSEPINEKIQAKEEKIDKKIDDWEEYRKTVREDLKSVISDNGTHSQKELDNVSAAISYSKSQIEKLKQKKIKINKKGLCVFALSGLAIKKIASDKFYKIKNSVENKVKSVKEEIVARKRAKAEDKVINEYNKKAERSKSVDESKSKETVDNKTSKILEQILKELKKANELKERELLLKSQEMSMKANQQYDDEQQILPAKK